MQKQISSSINGHLIQGAFYVLLLLAVCVIPFALAEPVTTDRSADQQKQALQSADAFAVAAPDTTRPRPTPRPAPTRRRELPGIRQKPYPAGIIWLTNADTVQKPLRDLSRFVEWSYPFVDGIRLRTCWNVVQPQSATYNWSTIDQALSLAAQTGKRVGVSIGSGTSTPQWVYDNGATKYRLLDNSGNSMPIPWEPAYYDQWLAFVRTFGARYDGNPALAYVIITGFMQTNGMFLADGQDEINLSNLAVQAGFPDLSTAYLFAAGRITSAIMDAFPTTACILTLQNPFPDLPDLQGTVRDWGVATYPRRFGTMKNGLTAVPSPHAPPPPPVPYPFGYQMICPANIDPAMLYRDPDPVPIPHHPTPLQDALQTGVTLGAQFVEVYKTDLELGIDWGVLAAEGARLKANLP